jgi:hypothetical protein
MARECFLLHSVHCGAGCCEALYPLGTEVLYMGQDGWCVKLYHSPICFAAQLSTEYGNFTLAPLCDFTLLFMYLLMIYLMMISVSWMYSIKLLGCKWIML